MAPINSGIKRRTFLKVLGTAAVALALPSAPAPAAREGWGTGSARPNLAPEELTLPAPREGFSVKFIRQYQFEPGTPTRIDVRYGWACVSPNAVCRVMS